MPTDWQEAEAVSNVTEPAAQNQSTCWKTQRFLRSSYAAEPDRPIQSASSACFPVTVNENIKTTEEKCNSDDDNSK